MKAGDQKIIGHKRRKTGNKIDDTFNVNVLPIKNILESKILQTTKKERPTYNYNALATNILMNYTIFKVGDSYRNLLNKVFREDSKIKNSVYFLKTLLLKYRQYFR